MEKQREYQRVCKKLRETLLKDEMTAIMVQLKIDRATRKSVTDGIQFIDVLEMREIIGVGNFHRLIPLLRDHELDHIALLLEKYMTDYEEGEDSESSNTSAAPLSSTLVGSNNTKSAGAVTEEGEQLIFPASFQGEKKDVASENTFVCEEHNAQKEAICLDCFVHTCYACAFMYHQDHEVLSMGELEVNIQKQTKEVQSEIRGIEKQLKYLENVQKVVEEKLQQPFELELQIFVQESLEALQAQKQRITESVNYIAELGMTDLEHTKMALRDVDNVIFLTEEEINTKLYPDNLTKLCELNKMDRKITESENRINEISNHLKDGSMEMSVRPSSVSAKLARVSHGCILGAVMTNAEQMVVISSQNNPKTFINVTCTSCFDPKTLFWKYRFELEVGPYPIVVANTLHVSPREMGILIGCGRYIIILRVTEPNDLLFFVEKKRDIHASIPKDSHVTGLSPITGKMQDKGIVVSDEKSGLLQIFDNKYQLTKRVKYPGNFPLVTCVFRDNVYKYAVCSVNAKSVELITANVTEETPRQFGKLCLVQNSTLHPQSLLFDGTFFTVLWVSGEETYSEGQVWKVIAYKIDGTECNVSKAGNCDPNVTAVSISHVKNETLLCFSNGTVDLFQTFKT
ncbi:hypothetical protein HOLleu_36960 [Holothuria leucospilota]|uniref:B box-type domain-containing protein n=1 Tax=Holothuria leucospilota TaxID=206669 RepID=A0A9Q0YRU5_HOLLE|nr:hypothetical protein HOLleu_36960 [Holothuria leucospilota]